MPTDKKSIYAARRAKNIELYGECLSPKDKARHRRSYEKHRRKILDQTKTRSVQKMQEDPVQVKCHQMVINSRIRAKRENVPHGITSITNAPSHCPILGIALCYTNSRIQDNSPTLDKVAPELGYVPGNVCVISWRANRMKSNGTIEEILKLAHFLQQWPSYTPETVLNGETPA